MSDKIQRYDIFGKLQSVWLSEKGDWVKHSDHELIVKKLEAKITELENQFDRHHKDCIR